MILLLFYLNNFWGPITIYPKSFFHSTLSIKQVIKKYIFKCISLVNSTLVIYGPIMYYVVYVLLHIICVYVYIKFNGHESKLPTCILAIVQES